MTSAALDVVLEVGKERVFASALDYLGWVRSCIFPISTERRPLTLV
ncbi:MAG: hypothetical protein WC005_11530 [Candidatus Nanopelagicales bacterium]